MNYRKEGWYIYSRSDDGNLGTERQSKRKEHSGLVYSEKLKTLKSSTLRKPLPNTVTEWIHHQKCLAFIVTPKKSEAECAKYMDEYSHVEAAEEGLWWTYGDRSFECSVEVIPGGILLLERETSRQNTELQELIYSEELKTWLSLALTRSRSRDGQMLWAEGAPVPSMVLDWLKLRTQKALREPAPMSGNFREQYFKAPW